MPRYRFQWESVPQPVLRRLARDLELPGDGARALAATYGKRPSAGFVRDTWPALRDGWLSMDTAMRRAVVEELRDRGLGDLSLPVRNRAQQQAYLATCRNSESLREVVLAAFHTLGDRGPARSPSARPTQDAGAESPDDADDPDDLDDEDLDDIDDPDLDDDAPDEWDRGLHAAWARFTAELRDTLAQLPPGDLVEITLPEIGQANGRPICPQIWFRAEDDDALEGGLMARDDLVDLDDLLGDAQQESLAALGWMRIVPRGGQDSDGEATVLAGGRADAARLARAAVGTARGVFGVVHPAFLELAGDWPAGTAGVGRPGEAAEPDDVDDTYAAPVADRTVVYAVRGAEHLRDLVDAALTPLVGGTPCRDADGDVPLDLGGPVCYVRIAADAAFVTVFAMLLYGVEGTVVTLERINELNKRYRMSCLTWDAGTVMVSIDLLCSPFVPALLREAITGVEAVTRDLDRIHALLGGHRYDEAR